MAAIEKTKKTILCAFVALLGISMNIHAQEFSTANFTAADQAQIDSMKVAEEATRSRFDCYQKSTGAFGRVWTDNTETLHPKIMVGGGYAINKFFQTPTISAGLAWDGIGLWKTTYEAPDGRLLRKPVRRWGAGLEFDLSWAQYLPGSVSAGQKYPRYETFLHADFVLFENKTCQHRLNAFLGVGYSYAQHDHLDYNGNYARVDLDEEGYPTGLHLEKDEDGQDKITILTGNHVTPHVGSGVFGGIGLSYDLRPIRTLASRVRVQAGAYLVKQVEYSETTWMMEYRGGISVLLGTWHNHQAPKRK